MTTSSARVIGLGSLLVALGTAGFLMIPGLIAVDAKGDKLVNAFYCSCITLTTVGYGDICPGANTHPLGKTFIIVLSFVLLGFFCGPMMNLASVWRKMVPGGFLILALATIGLGVAVFSQPMFVDGKAGLSVLDAIYCATVTGTTIGYGDFTPSTDEGKIGECVRGVNGRREVGREERSDEERRSAVNITLSQFSAHRLARRCRFLLQRRPCTPQ